MKEIKAHIRRQRVDQVVEKLREAGAPGVSMIEIYTDTNRTRSNPT
jgi:nitrogen regulatory protein PII